MKIAHVFNRYRTEYGGEVGVVDQTIRLLSANGHEVLAIEKSSGSIRTKWQHLTAFGSSFYSFSAAKEFDGLLRRTKPDLVHAHNLYPLFSPSILVAAQRLGVPTLMTIHNQLMTCPIGTHYSHNRICEKCKGGNSGWCVLKNCAESFPKSLNYALRFSISRRLSLFTNNVQLFIVQNPDVATELEQLGVPDHRITLIPNGIEIPQEISDPRNGRYCLFVGRLIHQKGIETLVRAAKSVPDIPILVAGDGPEEQAVRQGAPKNVRFLGRVEKTQLGDLFQGARLVVFPSQGYESFPLVVIEALSYGVPVVASRIRGPNSIVQDDQNGVFFNPGSASDLATKLRNLWDQPDRCRMFGCAGRAVVSRQFSEDAYYQRLIGAYKAVCAAS